MRLGDPRTQLPLVCFAENGDSLLPPALLELGTRAHRAVLHLLGATLYRLPKTPAYPLMIRDVDRFVVVEDADRHSTLIHGHGSTKAATIRHTGNPKLRRTRREEHVRDAMGRNDGNEGRTIPPPRRADDRLNRTARTRFHDSDRTQPLNDRRDGDAAVRIFDDHAVTVAFAPRWHRDAHIAGLLRFVGCRCDRYHEREKE